MYVQADKISCVAWINMSTATTMRYESNKFYDPTMLQIIFFFYSLPKTIRISQQLRHFKKEKKDDDDDDEKSISKTFATIQH